MFQTVDSALMHIFSKDKYNSLLINEYGKYVCYTLYYCLSNTHCALITSETVYRILLLRFP